MDFNNFVVLFMCLVNTHSWKMMTSFANSEISFTEQFQVRVAFIGHLEKRYIWKYFISKLQTVENLLVLGYAWT